LKQLEGARGTILGGYLLLPGNVGVHKQEVPGGEPRTSLHSPPLIPNDLRQFQYTGAVPTPWMQLNFIYGNSTVAATAILAATDATDAAVLQNVQAAGYGL